MFNPFPGLRPFEPGEDHLFFGREREIDELLRRLRGGRFLAIVGTSGSGKSSLVRSGLIPSLMGGFMLDVNPNWRIAIMRPGQDPLLHLARALDAPDVLGVVGEMQTTNRVLIEATLRRGARGLVEAVRQARISAEDNLLVVVDQFEELFRFRRDDSLEHSRDEAVGFVKLLLEAVQNSELPIYVVITMRSDFIGDCMEFPGLPEAVNAGQFLVPRMTRDELRSAISGPVAVGGGTIMQRLVLRLLNDFGDEYDQLPVLQHALMRTWDRWEQRGHEGGIDIDDYEAIGTFRNALSMHVEEAYEELGSEENKRIAEKIFKALTDTFSDHRGIRRPTCIEDLASICECATADVDTVVDVFRSPGRSFLMPPADVALEPRSVIDLSHESLMRCWTRLALWAEQEKASAEIYMRLSDAARWYGQGKAGFWRNPELEVAENWRLENRPTAAWAHRYNSLFPQAMDFLNLSEAERERISAETRNERRRKLRRARLLAFILGCLSLTALFFAAYSWRERRRAESNLQIAKRAVDESLSSVGRERAREGSDLPELEQLRGELLDKAQSFYRQMAVQNSSTIQLRNESALAHSRLGDINRLMGSYKKAEDEYRLSIEQFTLLAGGFPGNPEFRRAIAYCHNWLGETIRAWLGGASSNSAHTLSDADREYTLAIGLQDALAQEQPSDPAYRQELARTHYNRGIIRYQNKDANGTKSDFDQAIALLEPLSSMAAKPSASDANPDPRQDLGRVYNNYAVTLGQGGAREDAHLFYGKASALLVQLIREKPDNREYKSELARYYSNDARMLADSVTPQAAAVPNASALKLVEDLATPVPSISILMAQALQLQGQLLVTTDRVTAMTFTDQAFNTLNQLDSQTSNSAIYMNVGVNYLELAQNDLRLGDRIASRTAIDQLGAVLPHLSLNDRNTLLGPYNTIKTQLSHGH